MGSTGATDTMGTAGGQLMDLGLSFTDELKNVDQIPDVDRLGDLLMKEDDEEGAVLVSSPSRKPADANTTMTGSEEYDPNITSPATDVVVCQKSWMLFLFLLLFLLLFLFFFLVLFSSFSFMCRKVAMLLINCQLQK